MVSLLVQWQIFSALDAHSTEYGYGCLPSSNDWLLLHRFLTCVPRSYQDWWRWLQVWSVATQRSDLQLWSVHELCNRCCRLPKVITHLPRWLRNKPTTHFHYVFHSSHRDCEEVDWAWLALEILNMWTEIYYSATVGFSLFSSVLKLNFSYKVY